MHKQKLLCLTFWAISAALLIAPAVQAQNYPVKPVRIVVPTAPGGGTDLIGRLLAQNLSSQLGQQFMVDNRGGAGTTIGTAAVAKSPADGYTLLLTHSSLAFNATYYNKLPYDTLKDFAPISLVAEQPFLFAVHPSLPVKTVAQLITLAKKNPGQIAYSSGGAGSGPFMGAELFKLRPEFRHLLSGLPIHKGGFAVSLIHLLFVSFTVNFTLDWAVRRENFLHKAGGEVHASFHQHRMDYLVGAGKLRAARGVITQASAAQPLFIKFVALFAGLFVPVNLF